MGTGPLRAPSFLSPLPFPVGHRFEDVPGVRRHLVRKGGKGQVVHVGKDRPEASARLRKQDRKPHEVSGPAGRSWGPDSRVRKSGGPPTRSGPGRWSSGRVGEWMGGWSRR